MRAVHVVSYEPEGLTQARASSTPIRRSQGRRRHACGAATRALRHGLDRVLGVRGQRRTQPTDATLAAGHRRRRSRGREVDHQPDVRALKARTRAPRASDPGCLLRGPTRSAWGWADIAGEHGRGRGGRRHDFSLLDGPEPTPSAGPPCSTARPRALQVPRDLLRPRTWRAPSGFSSGTPPTRSASSVSTALTDEPTDRRSDHPHPRLGSGQAAASEALNERWEKPVQILSDLGYASLDDTGGRRASHRGRRRALRGGAGRALRGRLPRLPGQRPGSAASPGPSSTVTAEQPETGRLLVRRQAGRKRSCAPGRPPVG